MSPPPWADIYLLSGFCCPKTLDAGQSNAELESPRSRGAGGLWPSQELGDQFGLPGPVWPSRGVVSVLPLPELPQPQHLWHPGSASWALGRPSGAGSHSQPGSGGVCSHTQRAVPRRGHCPWACRCHPALGTAFPATPAAQTRSGHPFPNCARQGWLRRGCGLTLGPAPGDAVPKVLSPSSSSLGDFRAGVCKGQRIRAWV